MAIIHTLLEMTIHKEMYKVADADHNNNNKLVCRFLSQKSGTFLGHIWLNNIFQLESGKYKQNIWNKTYLYVEVEAIIKFANNNFLIKYWDIIIWKSGSKYRDPEI